MTDDLVRRLQWVRHGWFSKTADINLAGTWTNVECQCLWYKRLWRLFTGR